LKGCNEIQGFRGNCSKLGGKSRGETPFCRMGEIVFPKNNIDCWKMCPSLAALYASGFPRRAPVFQKAGGYWQDWHII
ncbi:MAG: hypothetical protein U0H73_00855, partial [Ruminococcus sp.]|nr:hypothetical protein [Ruminococcus sp.]